MDGQLTRVRHHPATSHAVVLQRLRAPHTGLMLPQLEFARESLVTPDTGARVLEVSVQLLMVHVERVRAKLLRAERARELRLYLALVDAARYRFLALCADLLQRLDGWRSRSRLLLLLLFFFR